MTDGPTGFHVAPITEDDMNRVTSILKRATDAILGMSQLAADVQMLRDTVSGLQADTDRLRNQNNALDEALNYSRGERDRQATILTGMQHDLSAAITEKEQVNAHNDKLELEVGQLQIDLDLTRKEKDEAQFTVEMLKEELATVQAKLAKVAELSKALFPPEPEPNPQHQPDPMPTVLGPTPSADPAPITDTRPDSLNEWEPGYQWDYATKKYWRAGVTPKHDGEDIPGF